MQKKVKWLSPKVWELQNQMQPNIAFAILESYYYS